MRLGATKASATSSYNGLGNQLYDLGGARPSLDLDFAGNKTLRDNISTNNLIDFTRQSSGTYVGSDGLIKTATTNLLLRSEEFDNTTVWTNVVGTVARNANAAAAPDGTMTADEIVFAAANNTFGQAATIVIGLTYTASIWVKGTAGETIRITSNGFTGGDNWTLTGEWQRISYSGVSTTTADRLNISTFGGVTARTLYAWGAQLEQSSTVGEYVKTTSTINSAPRFDHNPTTGESLGLLVEEARTNSIRNNTMVGAVAGTPGTLPTNWGSYFAPSGLTRTVVGTGVQNGINYVDIRIAGTPSSTGEITFYLENAVAATVGQAWCFTAWVAISSGTATNVGQVNLRNFQLNGGSYVRENNASILSNLTSTLTRFACVTSSFGSGANGIQPVLSLYASNTTTAIDITLRIGLPQLEQGAFATSVIPTTTAAVTRSADVASITGTNFSSWYRQDEGTVFANFLPGNLSANATVFEVGDNSLDNRINIEAQPETFLRAWPRMNTANFLQIDIPVNNVLSLTAPTRAAVAFATNNSGFAANGTIGATDTSCTIPVVDRAGIGQLNTDGVRLNGTISRLTYWPSRLPNSTLQTITQ